jgi:Kef-type K+ transport system membrane component KefB
MEYFVSGSIDNNEFRVPQKGEDNIVLRYKDPVPGGVLWPHVFMMFFAILFGMRAALSALFDPKTMRKWAIVALIGMSIGGMVLGPFVQKYAFGEYWTGFPYGGDFTDNKMLIMWLSWVFALAIIGFKPKKKEKISRVVVLMAAVVMTMVYLIPHSMGGSTLDYDKIDKGIDPTEAIKTGAN